MRPKDPRLTIGERCTTPIRTRRLLSEDGRCIDDLVDDFVEAVLRLKSRAVVAKPAWSLVVTSEVQSETRTINGQDFFRER